MKAITVYEPWAMLVAVGVKGYETRGWQTNYRGPIAIHAGKKPVKDVFREMFGPDFYGEERRLFVDKLREAFPKDYVKSIYLDLPLGAIVATATLVGCYKIETAIYSRGLTADWPKPGNRGYWDGDNWIYASDEEILFGDWTPGRFAWKLENIEKLLVPIPAKGAQGLWDWKETAA